MIPKIYNNTPYDADTLAALPVLGETVSLWRKRRITLYAHPSDADRLISIGHTFDGRMIVIAEELRDAWHNALDYIAHGKTYVSQ
jgi:hypothetical protein